MQSRLRQKRVRSPLHFVYFIRSENFVKIGWTSAIDTRLNNCQLNNPHPVALLAMMRAGAEEERLLHSIFREYHHRGEWFEYGEKIMRLVDLICGMDDPIEARVAAAEWYFNWSGDNSLRLRAGERDAMRETEGTAVNAR